MWPEQSSGAVWKSRWPSWAPIHNKPTVSVDVKQPLADQNDQLSVANLLLFEHQQKTLSLQFLETHGVTNYVSGWRKDVVNQRLEFVKISNPYGLHISVKGGGG